MPADFRISGASSVVASGRSSQSERAVIAEAAGSESEEPLKGTEESLRLVHHHPGYVRIRAKAFLHPEVRSPIVTSARRAAEAVAGFHSWSLNPTTGSVVIQYEPGTVEADDLLKRIAKHAGFRGVEISTRTTRNRRELVGGFLDRAQNLNRAVSELTSERADLRELVPLALVAVSVLSFVVNDERGRLPHWFSALYRSYRIFYQWHRREIRGRERAARQAEKGGSADSSSDDPA